MMSLRSKRAFTMIELVFVIVILGILAAVAFPRLAASRDDAKVSRMMMDIGTISSDIAAYAVSESNVSNDLSVMSTAMKGLVNSNEAVLDTINKKATLKMGGVDCISISIESNATNEDLNVSLISSGSANNLCKQLQDHVNVITYKIPLRGTLVVQ